MTLPLAGFVLAGGKSTRMGRDKAWLALGGKPLIERAVISLRSVCTEVKIAGGTPDLAQFAPVIPDDTPGCGPLGGIVAALEQTSFDWNLFHAVDVPFIPDHVWTTLAQRAFQSRAVAVIARVAGRPHPLCAAYHRRAAAILATELRMDRWKVTRAVEAAGPVEFVDFENASWFNNLNTPEDIAGLALSSTVG